MKRFIFSISLLAFMCSCNVYASCPEKLNFKGGVVVEGHIVSQEIGESVQFSVERVKATIPAKWVAVRVDANRNYGELNSKWKEWLHETGKESEYKDSKKSFVMLDMRLVDKAKMKSFTKAKQGDSISYHVLSNIFNNDSREVHIFEDGSSISFIDLTNCQCTFKWSDIRSVEFAEREPKALNGIVDVVEETDGLVYKGQIIEKVLSDRIRLKTSDGMIRSILNSNINCIKKEPLNPEVSILKQTPYLDEVNGMEGLITCQQINHTTPYIQFLKRSEDEVQISMDKITTIGSVKNDSYEPLVDIIITGEEAFFNRTRIPAVTCTSKKEGLFIDRDSLKTFHEIALDTKKRTIEVHMANTDQNKSAKLLLVKTLDKENDYNIIFPYKNILQAALIPKEQSVSVNNTLRIKYEVTQGYYVLYIPGIEKGYYCKIK